MSLPAYMPTAIVAPMASPTDTLKVDVLITGGSGFIGTALTEALIERGRSVCCADIAGFERLQHLSGNPRLHLETLDVLDATAVDQAVRSAAVVIHLAAVVGVDHYIDKPDQVLDVNIMGTRNVAAACARHDRPVLVASTSEVYGKTSTDLPESADMTIGSLWRSRWSYALSKATAEQYLYAWGRTGLRFVVVRYFNVYGPRMDRPGEGRVLSKFIGHIQHNEPLPLVEGGGAVRAFCYIEDAVVATLGLLDRLQGKGDVSGRAFNVGRAEPVTIKELAARVIALSGRSLGRDHRF
jgi:UDP-glucose 4-epimerase